MQRGRNQIKNGRKRKERIKRNKKTSKKTRKKMKINYEREKLEKK